METLDIAVFTTLHEQYNRLKSLQKNDKICTEIEPAWSSNEAKILLDTMISNLNNLIEGTGKDEKVFYRLLGMKGTLMYEEAKFLVNIGNELQSQELMSKTLDLLKDHFTKPEITFLVLRIINHYSFLLLKQGEFDKPNVMLESADQMYSQLKSKDADLVFYTADEIFSPNQSITPKKETPEKVDRLMINNLLMLGFVHSKKGNHEKYAYYNHQVLDKQLLNKDSDPTAWAVKAMKLASYFTFKQKFREARHHLAAACHVLEENETELKNSEPNEANMQKWEELQLRFGDAAKCWVNYGLYLFGVSKSRLVSLFYGEPSQFLENLWVPPYDVYPPNIFPKSHSPLQKETQDSTSKTTETSCTKTQETSKSHVSEDVPNSKLTAREDNVKMKDQILKISELEVREPTTADDITQNNEFNNLASKEVIQAKNEVPIIKINDESGENNENTTECSRNLQKNIENENLSIGIENIKPEEKNEDTGHNENKNKYNEGINTNKKDESDLNKERLNNEDKTLGNKPENNEEKIPSSDLKQHTLHNDAFHIIYTGLEAKDSGSLDDNHENSESAPKLESSKSTQQDKTVEDKNMVFASLDLSFRENQVRADFIENTEQARELFLYTHSWLKRSKMYFTLKDNPMDYVNAILDLSELYKFLAFYEEDIESQYSVQKRRADALETLSTVLREVRPQCYMAVSIELLRELAEVQLEMMGLNLRRLHSAQEAHAHGPAADFTLHKMEAMADIHSRLEQFGDSLGHRADLGDGLSEISPSEISGDSLP